ncbi:uncharacterized protein VP01_204g10 [Puccinia sorghi]|uniref:SCP domain-containing protein n=1 Tax=Puccinia sorghi TaxID=27349 RepID=A0A0L6VCP5_9BASI|nr:uncharacterized protein VP01_204g10 [Puccinia sorghi]
MALLDRPHRLQFPDLTSTAAHNVPKSDEEPHPRLSSRIALRAPATVTNEQLQNSPTESQLTGPTCGNSQPTRSTEEKPPPNGREIPHHAKVASYYKSALSLRRRGCMCPVPQDVQPTKENPTHERNESQEKKEMEEKEETAGHSGKKGETGHSEPSRTKNEIAKRPFPNEEKRPKSSHVVVSDPRDDAQPLVPLHHKTLSPPVERAINRSLFYPLTPQLSQPPSRDRSTSASKSSGKDASSRQHVRRKYSVGAVGWDAGLEASAQAWADRCVFEHSRGEWGENIAAGQPSVDAVVFDWVYGPDECSVYNPRVPIPSHFTQLVMCWVKPLLNHQINNNNNTLQTLDQLNNKLITTRDTSLTTTNTTDPSENITNYDNHQLSSTNDNITTPLIQKATPFNHLNTQQNSTHNLANSSDYNNYQTTLTPFKADIPLKNSSSDKLDTNLVSIDNTPTSKANSTTTQPTNNSNKHDDLDSLLLNSNLTTPFKDQTNKKQNSTSVNLGSFLQNDNLTSTPFKYNTSYLAPTTTQRPTNDLNKDDNLSSYLSQDNLTSTPFKINNSNNNSTSNKDQSNLTSFLQKDNLTSTPFKYNDSYLGNTTQPTNDLNSYLSKDNLTSTPFKLNSSKNLTSNKDEANLDSFLQKDNLTSTPFKYNTTYLGTTTQPTNNSDKDPNLASFISKDNLTSASIPFKYNNTNLADSQLGKNSTTDTADNNIASFLSNNNFTSASAPFQYIKPTTNDDKPSLLNAMNATVTSSPFKYNLTGGSRFDDSNVTLTSIPSNGNLTDDNSFDKANASLVSNPFKYNLTDSSSSHSNNSDKDLSLPVIGHDKLNSTLVSSPFQVNLSESTHLQSNGSSFIDKDQSNLVSPSLLTSNSTTSNLLQNNGSSTYNNTTSLGSTNTTTSNLTSIPYHNEQKAPPAFVPITSLFVNPNPAQAAGPSTPPPSVETTLPSTGEAQHKKASSTPFPSSWPRYIVPANAPTSTPANSTLISILFTEALNWPWLVTNSNASSQVLVFMPQLIASTLQIPEDQVVTQSLQAYQPANFNPNNQASMLALWLGYIPSQYVDELQAMIHAPQSRFYNNPSPVLRALAKTVDPSLPISSYEKKTPASQAAANPAFGDEGDSPATSQGQKIAVIASVTTCGAAILAIGLVIVARQSRRRMHGSSLPGSNGSSSLRIGAPMIGSFQRGHDGLPVPNREMEQVSAVPVGAGDARVLRSPESSPSRHSVHHEYGEARTTSLIQPPFSNGNDRASWWGRMSGILGNNAGGSHHRIEDHPISHLDHSNLSYESAVDAFNCPSSRAPSRRPQITRGADGLVSGIGRPVLKENSLFF